MSENDDTVLSLWNELKDTVSELELYVQKNAAGTVSAGAHVRKGAGHIKQLAAKIRKTSLVFDKTLRVAKKAAKAATK